MASDSEHSRTDREPLQFGIFDWIDSSGQEAADVYEQRLRMLELADGAGFAYYHLAEHQLTPLSLAPSPGIFLSSAIQRTHRIHLGPLGYLLPLYNPLRLIGEICMLDHLSRGRLEIGVGRGISPLELSFFNVDAGESREMFREALAIIREGLATGAVDHDGQYFHFHNVRLVLRPYQRPYPPFWYPTNYRESLPFMAQHNMNTLVHRVTAEEAAALFDEYRALLDQHRDDSGRINAHVPEPKLGLLRLVHVAETDEIALRQARASFEHFQGNMGYLQRTFGSAPAVGVRVRPMERFDDELAQGRYLAGSPATVREQIEEQVQRSGCTYFVGAFATGNLPSEQVLTSLSLFAEHVMPALRAAPAASLQAGD
jgi:alkanesulfonate monooxygenase SsuD/methylene tetrahydromethanopterin reductase-like flavin-dependent oxidoreductase (luciferase family)